jgi:cobyrinic acid a,c-diamide synthase
MFLPRIVIGGTGSGCGKTTVVCAILKALKDRGLNVSAAKCGPDYIDPMFHKCALKVPSKNIDLFFSENNTAKALFAEHAQGSDICVIEGVMGYYDGLSFDDDKVSTYSVADVLSAPSVIVLNARGMALTASALIQGMINFRDNSRIRAVILNNISPMSFEPLKKAIEDKTGIEVLGFMPNDSSFNINSRHLGLVTPDESTAEVLEKMSEAASKYIDLNRLMEIASEAGELEFERLSVKGGGKFKIAVALDEAFCFYYSDNLELLRKMGAEIEFFSPIYDKTVPDADGMIIGGGYPELYAEKLSENTSMLNDIRIKIENGMPCLAECGGFMYLSSAIDNFKMTGIFKGNAYDTGKLSRFGYIELKSEREYINGIKGHEFHHWDMDDNGSECIAVKPSGRSWNCMSFYKNTIAGYPHLYYWSKPEFAQRFADICRLWRK